MFAFPMFRQLRTGTSRLRRPSCSTRGSPARETNVTATACVALPNAPNMGRYKTGCCVGMEALASPITLQAMKPPLTTSSVSGTTLTGSNTVSNFTATNTTSGDISLTNTAAPLTITAAGITETGGNITVSNTGSLTTSGTVLDNTAGNAISLTATTGVLTIGAAVTGTTTDTISLTSTGSNNIALGYGAGDNLSGGSSNIDIGNQGSNADNNLIRIGTGQTATYLVGTVYANGVSLTSDRNAKENFEPVDSQAVLAKVAALPVTEWNYKDSKSAQHLGPVAQDFQAAFGLNGGDDTHISVVDEGGVALAAIQGLNDKLEARSEKVEVRSEKVRSQKSSFDVECPTTCAHRMHFLRRSTVKSNDGGITC